MKDIKFCNDWLARKDLNGFELHQWCVEQKDDAIGLAVCIVCECTVNYKVKGFQALQQHYSSKKHIANAKTKLCCNQTNIHIIAPLSNIEDGTNVVVPKKHFELASKRDVAAKAELIWSMKNVVCNMSAASTDGIVHIFNAMFPGAIPKEFSISSTKLKYLITEALGPYFRKQVIEDLRLSYFTLMYDETTNCEGRKELQVGVRYWSNSREEIVSSHLETFFMGRATGEDLIENLMKSLDNAGLNLDKVIMMGSDGPNVNKKVFRLMSETVKNVRDKSLLNIGTCNIHIVHNSFLKGLQSFETEAADLVIYVFNYFTDYPSRLQDFEEIQHNLKLPPHKLIKHVSSRWLTLETAVNRFLEQYEAISEYFLNFIPAKCLSLRSNFYYPKIVKSLQTKTIKAELSFISCTAHLFTNFTRKFQSQMPLIHILHEELRSLILVLANRLFPTEELKSMNYNLEEIKEKLRTSTGFIPSKNFQCGDNANKLISTLSEDLRLKFLQRCIHFFADSCRHLLEKSSVCNGIIKYFRFLKPELKNMDSSCRDIIKVAQVLPIDVSSSIIHDEWKCLQMETIPLCVQKSERIDHYWRYIFQLKDSSGKNQKFPCISVIVKAILSLSHGSADIERGFSKSARVLTDDKASMSLRLLNARLNVSDGLKFYNDKPELVPITNDLMTLARSAYSKYKSFLEDKKKEEEAKTKLVLEKEAQRKHDEIEVQLLKERKKKIDELEEDLKEARNEEMRHKQINDKLLEEASERLKNGIVNKDFVEIGLAQSMIEACKKKRIEEKSLEVDIKQKKIEKRKSHLISDFFSKRPKL